jgi:dTMP kinase
VTAHKKFPVLKHFHAPQSSQGLFITFEGIEGCGKSTQIDLARQWFEKNGRKVLMVREPGGTSFGESLRQAILGQQQKLHALAEAHLFCASRAQLLTEKILPMLANKSGVVLCDRYLDSSIAYQGLAGGLGIQTILELHQHAPLNLLPDRTYYLKISVEESYARQQLRGNQKDYFESQKSEFHQSLVSALDQLAQLFPERFIVLDGARSVQDVWAQIQSDLEKLQQAKG